jgi:putative phosphoribosyl transferase
VIAVRAGGAGRVVIAAPIGARDSVDALRAVADDVVTLATPEPFVAVGEWYTRFDQVRDTEIEGLLAAARRRTGTG